MNQRQIGTIYEKKAAHYLEQQGMKIIEYNFYTYFGEIDLIAKDGDELVFIEVKYRKNLKNGFPQEAVTKAKQRKIAKSAEYYIYKNHLENESCRFDVVAVVGDEIFHIKNAWEIDGC